MRSDRGGGQRGRDCPPVPNQWAASGVTEFFERVGLEQRPGKLGAAGAHPPPAGAPVAEIGRRLTDAGEAGDSYSDVIIRLAVVGNESVNGSRHGQARPIGYSSLRDRVMF
jgi:hypothetical protein